MKVHTLHYFNIFILLFIPSSLASLFLKNSNGDEFTFYAPTPIYPFSKQNFSVTSQVFLIKESCEVPYQYSKNVKSKIIFYQNIGLRCDINILGRACYDLGCNGFFYVSTYTHPGIIIDRILLPDILVKVPSVILSPEDSQIIYKIFKNEISTPTVTIQSGDFNLWTETLNSISFSLFIIILRTLSLFLFLFCCLLFSYYYINYRKDTLIIVVLLLLLYRSALSFFYFLLDPLFSNHLFPYWLSRYIVHTNASPILLSTILLGKYFNDLLENYSTFSIAHGPTWYVCFTILGICLVFCVDLLTTILGSHYVYIYGYHIMFYFGPIYMTFLVICVFIFLEKLFKIYKNVYKSPYSFEFESQRRYLKKVLLTMTLSEISVILYSIFAALLALNLIKYPTYYIIFFSISMIFSNISCYFFLMFFKFEEAFLSLLNYLRNTPIYKTLFSTSLQSSNDQNIYYSQPEDPLAVTNPNPPNSGFSIPLNNQINIDETKENSTLPEKSLASISQNSFEKQNSNTSQNDISFNSFN